jgi:ribosomal protein S18 acetylase RimI-like enzyme
MAHSPMTNTDTKCKIRRMESSDVAGVAAVHTQSFSRQLARISHTFSDSSHTLHDDLASQVSEAVLHEHCPRPLERQSQSAERRSVQKKCEKCGLDSEEWILCNFRAYPRIRIIVAHADKEIVGYIQWMEKSGFRKEVVLELEQIAVLPEWRSQGIGSYLINSSLSLVKEELAKREAVVKHIVVTTRTDNNAQKIYRETLNASVETTIPDLFSADEVIMIARDVSKQKELKRWNQ